MEGAKPVRAPRQERGKRRVEAILQAAEELVAEGGVEAVTMLAVGKRSGTAVGSLYHFFPDREAVLMALVERYSRGMHEHAAPSFALTMDEWRALPLDERIERFIGPLARYIADHPHAMGVVMHSRRNEGSRAVFADLEEIGRALGERLVAACEPEGSERDISIRVTVVSAAVDGVLEAAGRMGPRASAALLCELRRMLACYLC